MSGAVLKEGAGKKQGGFIKNWKTRWFVLRGTTLDYLEKKGGKPKGSIELTSMTKSSPASSAECPKQPALKIELGHGRVYFVQLNTAKEVDEWVQALEKAKPKGGPAPAAPAASAPAAAPAAGGGKKVTVEDFELLRVIGRGSYGKVQLVRSKGDKCLYAMKSLRKRALRDSDQLDQTMVERNVLLKTVHPFLVGAHWAFQSDDKIFLVLDYVPGGELFSRLREEQKFTEDRTRLYAAEVLLGLGFLHAQGFVYRDLKPENILVDRDGHLRITDFGLVKTEMAGAAAKTGTFCGTPDYIAPEMLQGLPYTRAVDWWSYGILVYEMLCGMTPFFDENSSKMYRMVINDPVRYPGELSARAKDLIGRLLEKNPALRLGACEADVEEIKAHAFFSEIHWDALLRKEIEPAWKPQLKSEVDVGNFDEEFTGEKQGVSFEESAMIGDDVKIDGFTFTPGAAIG
jgi:serine/threonine protein kinase